MTLLNVVVLLCLFGYSRMAEEQMALEIEAIVNEKIELLKQEIKSFSSESLPLLDNEVKFIVYGKSGKVQYWSDNAFIPPFDYFPFGESDNIISTLKGDFLFQKRKGQWDKKDALIVAMIPIRRSFNSSNSYLKDVYNRDVIRYSVDITNNHNSIPIHYEDEVLFRIKCSDRSFYNSNVNLFITILLSLCISGALILSFHSAVRVKRKKGFGIGFIYLSIVLVILRSLMFLAAMPNSFGKLNVFVEGSFTYNWFFRTLGDTVVNVMLINIVILYCVIHGYSVLKDTGRIKKLILGSTLLIGSYVAFFLFVDTISLISVHSQISIDIAQTLDFTTNRVATYFLISVLGILFFQIHFLAYRVLSWSTVAKQDIRVLHLVIGFVSFLLLVWYEDFLVAFGLNVIYIIGLYLYDMPKSLASFKFESVSYILFSAVILSLAGSFIIFKAYEKDELYQMQKFATHLEVNRDFEGEYLLSNIINQISQDVVVNSKMLYASREEKNISRKIKRSYLTTYFNDYDIDIFLFDKEGKAISNKRRGSTWETSINRYQQQRYETGYDNIFYDGRMDRNRRKRYICFTALERYGSINGYIGIELKLKKFSSKSVLPQLLQDRRVKSESIFDYAIFAQDQIIFKSGTFEYESAFDTAWLAKENLYEKGLDRGAYRHYASGIGKNNIVITTPAYKWRDIVSNFSFLFVIFLVWSCLLLLIKYLVTFRRRSLNFSTKVLVFSGVSFVFPMLLVAVAILSSTDSSYRKEIDKSNLKSTRLMAENLDDPFIALKNRQMNREEFEHTVSELATHAAMDINVYNTQGVLMASSTPEIFESGIISKYINPAVLKVLIDSEKESVSLEETIGTFQYKTSYVTIKSSEDGSVLGLLASPYFGSKNHLKRQQLVVFTNIIIIFTFVFIFSVWVAYYIISKMTQPIIEIADRLHDTGFVQTNQPIDWEADDEIGMLVKEYNNMLSKLEATKQELAQNEKEAAWREMAKQVAHEIKNPLTPMKLTLQHLQRILGGEERDKKSLDILLNQIDTLDEIVTSFSHFAKMPTPVKEPFDMIEVLNKSLDLHVDKNIHFEKEKGEYLVEGDKKLFGRIFNNLILNAFQAMKYLDYPKLYVKIGSQDENIVISFKDEGEGIPLEIRDKVFTPNFSTKETGSGIGLAVAKRGIEHAGGEIWFESPDLNGTTFFIQMKKVTNK